VVFYCKNRGIPQRTFRWLTSAQAGRQPVKYKVSGTFDAIVWPCLRARAIFMGRGGAGCGMGWDGVGWVCACMCVSVCSSRIPQA
jgi:hypothetical protein